MRFSDVKMKPKLIFLLVLTAFLPLLVSGIFTYQLVSKALMKKSYDELLAIREIKKSQIESFFAERQGDVKVLSHTPEVLKAFSSLDAVFKSEGGPQGDFKGKTNEVYDAPATYTIMHDQFFTFFKYYIEQYGYYDLFLMDIENGDICFTVTKEADFAQRTASINSSLKDVWAKAKKGEVALSDTKPYAPSAGAPAMFVAAPITDNGSIVGVVALQISIDAINAIMQERSGLGDTGETYLVGADYLMRSDSFLDPVNHTVFASFANPSKGQVTTDGVERGLAGTTAEEVIIDYNGNPVLSAYTPIDLGSFLWILLAEIDEAEVRLPIQTFLYWTLVIGAVLIVFSAITAVFVGGQIAKPLMKSAKLAEEISKGNLTQEIDIDQKDEVGALSASLNQMTRTLRAMFVEISGGVETLNTSSNELSAIATQMTSSSEQTSGKANSVATAAEEMSANMDSVAAASEEVATNVNMVAAAAEEMTITINEIATNTTQANVSTSEAAAEAATAAERVHELGIAAKEISKVTETITEISEQTNLLALNATIEAARAGEAGKGFAVVANEIKELAKQTAEATQEIKDKIEAVQQSSNMTVDQIGRVNLMVQEAKEMTEAVSVAVEEQSATTQEISGSVNHASIGIQEVTENVAQSSLVAGEVAKDIAEIDSASTELRQSSGELQESSGVLTELAGKLSIMMGRYKV